MADRIPALGSIPPSVVCLVLPALVFMEMGLLMFMVPPGLNAEKISWRSFSHQDSGLVAAGVVVTSIPVAIGYLFGRYVLKTDPVLLTGAGHMLDCKRRTIRVSLRKARSPMPTIWLQEVLMRLPMCC